MSVPTLSIDAIIQQIDISLTPISVQPRSLPHPAQPLALHERQPMATAAAASTQSPAATTGVILFDIYGTILLSAAGEIGNTVYSYGRQNKDIEQSFARACQRACRQLFAVDHPADCYSDFHALYLRAIRNAHAVAKLRGIQTPEVEIRDIWRGILDRQQTVLSIAAARLTAERIAAFAAAVELLTNPVQLAPGIAETLAALRQAGYRLGIVSNAQFYTPLILEHLFHYSLAALGFERPLCYWSYEHRIAKPARHCFEYVAAAIATTCRIAPAATLYIGNDMQNDIIPAAAVGFRTCLYCGDSRSLRLSTESAPRPGCPDTWISDYGALLALIGAVTQR